MGRYDPLTAHLRRQSSDELRMSFAEIEQVLGRPLPESAGNSRAFWSNNASNNVMTRAWLDAGFQSEQVDLTRRSLVFRRTERESRMPGLEEAPAVFALTGEALHNEPALFGWLAGTVVTAAGVDLGEPADPAWADIAERG